jgi:HAE1 family hydrophobic/amphiphilic exporter-1
MTTATTVLALGPLALGTGEAAELRAPLALTVIGGLFASTLGSLFVVPCLYLLLDRLRFRARAAGP